jgi:hypothetical protein
MHELTTVINRSYLIIRGVILQVLHELVLPKVLLGLETDPYREKMRKIWKLTPLHVVFGVFDIFMCIVIPK